MLCGRGCSWGPGCALGCADVRNPSAVGTGVCDRSWHFGPERLERSGERSPASLRFTRSKRTVRKGRPGRARLAPVWPSDSYASEWRGRSRPVRVGKWTWGAQRATGADRSSAVSPAARTAGDMSFCLRSTPALRVPGRQWGLVVTPWPPRAWGAHPLRLFSRSLSGRRASPGGRLFSVHF